MSSEARGLAARSRWVEGILTVALLGIAASCGDGGSSEGDERPELIVFAAASTTDVVSEIAASFDRARVKTSFGPSSGLARQVRDRAPADVYISASRRWIDYLADADCLAGSSRAFVRNRLVCIAAEGSALASRAPTTSRELVARIATGDRIAIADAGVPAGDYARQSLAATGDLGALRSHLVGQEDVRAVLRAVDSGQAVAGFVYTTEARAAAVVALFPLDPATHDPIAYHAAMTRQASDPALARAFLDHLESPAARRILAAAGFEIDEK